MNILVLSKGFIASRLTEYLIREKHTVYNFSREELDYGDKSRFFNFLDKTAIDAVVNCAGFTGKPNVDECEVRKEECFIQNSILPRDIEEVCKIKRVNLIHVSSGCIYTGYDKEYTEDDEPNFGMFDSDSSFYSKTKHAGELNLDTNFTNIIRIRMPIEGTLDSKNLLHKLKGYNKLIDYKNSKTDVTVLCEFIETVIDNFKPGIFNAVHSNSLTTKEVIELSKEYPLVVNPEWEFVDFEDLNTKCGRSNCVLSNDKSKRVFDFDWGDEEYYIRKSFEAMSGILQEEEKQA